MKIIHKLKDENERTLGYYKANFDGTNQRIEIFLPLAIKQAKTTWGMVSWNNFYSHIVSHEVMHKVIHDIAGQDATAKFDNIAGRINTDVKQIRTGMNEYKLTKCQNDKIPTKV